MDQLYTTHDISRLLQVDPSTVSKWIDRGILMAFRTPGGHRRVRSADICRVMASWISRGGRISRISPSMRTLR